MNNNDNIRAVDCPSCGAPIQIPEDGKRFFTCQFCGTTLENQTTSQERKTGQFPKVVVHPVSTTKPYKATLSPTVPRRSKRRGWSVLFLIIVLVAVGVTAPLFFSGALTLGGLHLANQLTSLQIYSFGTSQLIPSDNDTQSDIVSVSRNSDETCRMVYVDFDADPRLRWQSEPLGDGANYTSNPIIVSGSSVFLAYKTTLVAFNRADGTITWQVELSDEITNICEHCLQIFDDSVVALTSDGMLSGFGVQTGDLTWSVRLNETPRQMMNLAGKVGVLDEEDDVVGINVYDPVTGFLVRRIVPECPNGVFPDYPQTLSIYDPVFVSSDGENIFVPINDYDPACIQKWDASNLSKVWEAPVPEDILQSMTWKPYLFTDEALYISDGNNLYSVSMVDGSYQDVFSTEDHNLIPLVAQDGILVSLAEKTRGTSQYTLFGIDIAARAKRWEYIPVAKDIYEDMNNVIDDGGLWSAYASPGKIVVFEAFSEPGIFNFTVLNPDDGTILDDNAYSLNEDEYNWLQIIGWRSDRVYLITDAQITVIDIMSATEIARWP